MHNINIQLILANFFLMSKNIFFFSQNGHVNGQSRSPPKENGLDLQRKKDAVSPASGTSSTSSTPAPKKSVEEAAVKPPTPKSTPPATAAAPEPHKPALSGPPYGLPGFPPPPPVAGNGLPPAPPVPPVSEAYRSPYDPHPALRAPPPIGLPPGGKPYVRVFNPQAWPRWLDYSNFP